MNKKVLFTIAPMVLIMSSLVSCDKNECTVKFDTDGGTTIADVKVKKNATVARPTVAPIKSGFTFTDWYTTKEGDTKFDFDNTKIVANTTIFAHYVTETDVSFTIEPKNPVVVAEGEEKQLQIKFDNPDAPAAVSSIEWNIKDPTKLQKVDEAVNHMTFKFKALATTDVSGSDIEVTVKSKSGGQEKKQTANVQVDPAYTKYLEFTKIDDTTNVSVKKKTSGTLPSELTIPSTVDGEYVTSGTEGTTYNVTEIEEYGFSNVENVTKINLPNTIKEIGQYAFEYCNDLATINLPNSLQKIDKFAFAYTELESFTIPSSVTYIGRSALAEGEKNLTSLTFEDESTNWVIDPDNKVLVCNPKNGVLAEYNSNKDYPWYKCAIGVSYDGATTVKAGETRTLSFSGLETGEGISLDTSDETVLTLGKQGQTFQFTAVNAGNADILVKTSKEGRYGGIKIVIVD